MNSVKNKTSEVITKILNNDESILNSHSEFVKYCNTSKKTACPRCNPTSGLTCYINFMKKKCKPKKVKHVIGLPTKKTLEIREEFYRFFNRLKQEFTPKKYIEFIYELQKSSVEKERFFELVETVDWELIKSGTEIKITTSDSKRIIKTWFESVTPDYVYFGNRLSIPNRYIPGMKFELIK